ncbi:hypothetical protein Q9L58_007071 [Maublancomyces gigas]|uniref:Uncharacterized protein n=1 Tax=Discina gigas TaxID=1032678 RepID=A0ABR3GEF7_9PEZI
MTFTLLPRIFPAQLPETQELRYKESKYEELSDDDERSAQPLDHHPKNSTKPVHLDSRKSAAERIEALVFSLVLGLVVDTVMARMLTRTVLEMELEKLNGLIDRALGLSAKDMENELTPEPETICIGHAASKDDGAMSNAIELTPPEGSWKWRPIVGYILAFLSYLMVAATCDIRVTGACTSIWLMFFLVRSRFFQPAF